MSVAFAGLLAQPFLMGAITLGALSRWLGAIIALTAAAVLAYWTYGLVSLRYVLTGTHLTIHWAGAGVAIPLAAVERVLGSDDLGDLPRLAGLRWPGYCVGYGQSAELGTILAYSAHRSTAEQVCVVTPGRAYLLSVPDPERFRQELEEIRRLAGPPSEPDAALGGGVAIGRAWHWSIFDLPIFQDSQAFSLLLAALVSNFALFAFVALVFPTLPEWLPLHLTPTGEVDAVGLKADLLRLPAMAFMVLASNLVLALALHLRERLAAMLCLAAGLFVQVLFWVAVLKIVYP